MAEAPLHDVQLYRMDLPEHSCPWGLKARQLLLDQGIPFTDHRLTNEQEVQAFKARHQVATTPQVFSAGERIGGYTDLAARLRVKPEPSETSYIPVLAVFGTALLLNGAIGGGPMHAMGLTIAMLAMLKLMDVAAFATSFLKYDLLSQRWAPYAQLYPGLELLVALGFLADRAQTPTAILALLLGLSGMVSVYKAVVIDKLALNCACVGGNSKAPLGVVSFAENVMMVVMGAALLLQ